MECYPIERKPAFIPPPPPQKSLDQLPLYDNAESNDNPPQQQPSHLLFDEYDTASLWSYKANNLERLWTFHLDGRIVLSEFWNTWKNYGYHLIPHFFSLSQKQSPICYIDCCWICNLSHGLDLYVLVWSSASSGICSKKLQYISGMTCV